MTDFSRDYQNKQCRLNLVSITTSVLALLYLVLAIATSNVNAKLVHTGMTLMLMCIFAGIIHFRARTPAERPPAVMTSFSMFVLAGFCLGSVFVGASIAGITGMIIEIVPTVLALAAGIWYAMSSDQSEKNKLDA